MSAERCDQWRAEYDQMSFADQLAFYDEIAEESPEQLCYDLSALEVAFGAGDVQTVTEIGGWRGEAAESILSKRPLIERWSNYEVCRFAVENPRCAHPGYEAVLLECWPWEMALPAADLLVGSHVLEHARFREVDRLAEQFRKFRKLHFQIPINLDTPNDWAFYDGTHILEASWKEVDMLIRSHGFRAVYMTVDAMSRTYVRVDG